MFVNQQAEFNFSGILENEISYHQAVVVNTKLILPHTKTRYITIYSNSEEDKNNFKMIFLPKIYFFLYRKNLFMKEKLDKKEQHKLYTLFTIYRSNIAGKTSQFINNK